MQGLTFAVARPLQAYIKLHCLALFAFQKPIFVALGVVIVTMAFGLVTFLLKKQGNGKKKRPVA